MRSVWAILVAWCVALAGGQRIHIEQRADHRDARLAAALDVTAPVAERRHAPGHADRHEGGQPLLAASAARSHRPPRAVTRLVAAPVTSLTPTFVATRSSRGPPDA